MRLRSVTDSHIRWKPGEAASSLNGLGGIECLLTSLAKSLKFYRHCDYSGTVIKLSSL